MGGGEDMSAGQFTLLAYSQQRLSPEESSGTEAFLGTDSFFSLSDPDRTPSVKNMEAERLAFHHSVEVAPFDKENYRPC